MEAPSNTSPVTTPLAGRGRRAAKVVLLAAVLVVHFLSRQYLVKALPVTESTNYPFVYRTALALLAGRGFTVFRVSDAPESVPVADFLEGRRDGLSRQEFRRFLDGPDGQPVPCPDPAAPTTAFPPAAPTTELAQPVSPWHTSRVLDLYVTAALWRLFGVRWSVLLTFCALASTAACLLVFFAARRVGGGFWPGLCAAVLYLASPLENDYAISCLRDISPLWFAALAFAIFFCLVERFRSAPANLAALALLGLVCTLGCGWRSDAMLLAPFLGASSAVLLLIRRRSWRYLLAAGAAFCLGALPPLTAIRWLCPAPVTNPLVGFHVGYYGEFDRCNALGLENTFGVSRDDIDADMTAQQYHADHDHAAPFGYLGSEYGSACFRMYREEIPQNLYHWVRGFPEFYLRALDACRLRDLAVVGRYPPPLPRPRWLAPAATWVLGPLSAAGPWLFGLGVCVSLLRPGQRWRSLCLAGFSVFHAVVLFLILPEFKHAGLLVLPLTVFGGVGLASLRGLFHPGRLMGTVRTAWRPALCLAGTAAAVALVWAAACVDAYAYSVECRRELLHAIATHAASGKSAPETLQNPKLFSVTLLPDKGDGPVGYLLRIAAGPGESFLDCRRLHHERPPVPGGVFTTRHRLHPDREQCFFVTCQPGTAFGDVRPFVCTAVLYGDARFLSCTRVDLSEWRRLPASTVFVPGECDPGNPVVGGRTAITEYAENTERNYLGLSLDELLRVGAAPAVSPPGEWRPASSDVKTERTADGLRVRTPPQAGAYAVEAPFTAPADGTYFFRLRLPAGGGAADVRRPFRGSGFVAGDSVVR